MTNEQKVSAWLDTLAGRHERGVPEWTARFLISGFWPQVGAAEDLAPFSGAISADGTNEFVVTFNATYARETLFLLAEQGAWLCDRQTPVP